MIDTSAGTVTVPLWGAGIGVALLLLFLLVALFRAGIATVIWTIVRVGLVGVAVVAAWAFLGQAADRDHADERRALDQRIQDLSARATMPGSSLGCLDLGLGEALDDACEKAIFAGPDTVAAATAYVAAKLSLLADVVDYANRVDPNYATATAGLRRAIEADRFGIVAQVLAARDGCTPAECSKFALLSDATQVSAHLKDGSFDGLLARYSSAWPQRTRPGAPMAAASQAPASGAPTVGMTYPSAASIPPVSIMTNEPAGAPAAASPAASALPKRTASAPAATHQVPRVVHHPAPAPVSPPAGVPVQLAPPAAAAGPPPPVQ